jgi:XTP/dITP diphosphohydrolase
MDLVVATRSEHKMREIRRILAIVPQLRLLDLDEAGVPFESAEEGLEPHDTFEENALSKAAYFYRRTGLPTVADDSGLMVDSLGGAPGVRSKRFAPDTGLVGEARDRANNEYLLTLLSGRAPRGRSAKYVCVAALTNGREAPIVCRGETAGVILDQPRGTGGFGYDPLFEYPDIGRTFAEITEEEKNERSHRGRAFRSLATALLER